MKRKILFAIILLTVVSGAFAQISRKNSYQGVVIDAGGPIADRDHTLTFRIYESETSSDRREVRSGVCRFVHGPEENHGKLVGGGAGACACKGLVPHADPPRP